MANNPHIVTAVLAMLNFIHKFFIKTEGIYWILTLCAKISYALNKSVLYKNIQILVVWQIKIEKTYTFQNFH